MQLQITLTELAQYEPILIILIVSTKFCERVNRIGEIHLHGRNFQGRSRVDTTMKIAAVEAISCLRAPRPSEYGPVSSKGRVCIRRLAIHRCAGQVEGTECEAQCQDTGTPGLAQSHGAPGTLGKGQIPVEGDQTVDKPREIRFVVKQ